MSVVEMKWDHNRRLKLGQMPDEIVYIQFEHKNVPFIDFALASATIQYEMYLMEIPNENCSRELPM